MFDEISGILVTFLGSKPTARQKFIAASLLVGAMVFLFSFKLVSAFLLSPNPVIQVLSPQTGSDVAESETLLVGKVSPPDSKVLINGRPTLQNGDGNFSQTVELNEGKNTFKIEAEYFWKKSGLFYQAVRVLSEAEKLKQANARQKEEQKINEQAQKLAEADQKNSVLGSEDVAYDQSIIQSQELRSSSKGNVIVGKIKNTTAKTIGWIKVTATFTSPTGSSVDSKEIYATQADQYLAPGAEMQFEVPSSDRLFSEYKLSVIYDAM